MNRIKELKEQIRIKNIRIKNYCNNVKSLRNQIVEHEKEIEFLEEDEVYGAVEGVE